MPAIKEKTALIPFVGANGGQSSHKKPNDSIADSSGDYNGDFQIPDDLEQKLKEMQRAMDPHYFHTKTMSELYQTAYQGRPSIIEGLIYEGVYILAGAPKIGKSFLVAQLAYHIGTGAPLWGFRCHQGTVLYLALEDDFQRLQSRMFMMYGIEDTDKLHFDVRASKIGSGLEEQMQNFVRDYKDTKVIIIDTLQKIREVGGDAYSYANDYEIIGKLKQFADNNHICILVVHHTRKQAAGDAFEMISGTTGLLGCADGAFLMRKEKQTDLSASIEVVGRDQQDQVLYLNKDPQTQIWELEKTENEPWKEPPDPLLVSIDQLLTDGLPEWQGSATELAEALHTEMQTNVLTKRLNIRAGKLQDEYHIRYENSHGRNGSCIKLVRQAEEV